MAYDKQTWVRGEKVASAKLNHMEDGIAAISANGAIDTANLAPAAVTNDKLDQEAVDSNNIRVGAIITPLIYDGAVTLNKMGQDVVDVLFDSPELPSPLNAWIRYSNGEKVSSSATNLYVFKSVLPKRIKAFLTSDTNVLCAIAFYTTDDISTDGYMQSESVDFASGVHNDGLWYNATVPETCKTIAIVTKKPSSSVADSTILFDRTSTLRSDLVYTENVIDNLPFVRQSQYIRYSDGKNIDSGTYFRWYSIPNNGITKIKAQLYSGDTVPAVIAFYTSDFNADTFVSIDTSTYLQNASIKAIAGWGNYEADVPTECKTILICTRTDNTSEVPSVQFLNNEIGALAYCFATKKNADVNSQIEAINQKIKTQSPFTGNMCFDHLFVNQVTNAFTSNIIIPCQSIFGVQVSARLGFKYIEANVHKTSDGNYVVTHGINGNLGNDFETLSGEPCSDVVIRQTTFSDLRNNYRYRSSYAKYRVPITSLEEFCYECKRYGMGVVLQYVDATELSIAKGILGDNIVLYLGNRTVWNGYIMEYLGYSTKEEILSRCRSIGVPYMYNMSNPHTFTDAQLKEIVDALHNEGFLIGFAGAYQNDTNVSRYINLGFDFNASGKQVNDFEYGNVYDLCGDLDYTGITHTGTVENGVLHLADGQYIRLTGNANFLTKISMHVTFSGKLYVDGVESGVYIESDGSNSVWNSRFFLNTEPIYKWVSQGDTYIKNITVKASKC